MRFDTHHLSKRLLEQLHRVPIVLDAWDDGSDVLIVTLATGQVVSIELIERPTTLAQFRLTMTANNNAGFHTLFVFRAEFLLPPDNEYYVMDDWMAEIVALYGNVLYGYDVFEGETFPVYFLGEGRRRYVRYGAPVTGDGLGCVVIQSKSTEFEGFWRVASFNLNGTAQQQHIPDEKSSQQDTPDTIRRYFALLKLEPNADADAIKQAYRALARRYHPDINRSADATHHMQRINEAYFHIMRYVNGD